ncbi:DUF6923 family protein [Paludisphaera soli]|uniref:DUF6923 family protein n=1 Tax=Paludisphaera soli TaxID=2712865 RepID=UPI0013EAB723|nr:PEP-CTERM sorting domain-containing protein [Paludisphaera soli]
MLRRMVKGLAATVMGMGVMGGAASADVVYGIDNANNLIRVDLATQTSSVLFDTPLSGASNGVALDATGNHLVFRNNEGGTLRSYDIAGGSLSTVANPSNLALPGLSSDASFYDGAYWYVRNNSDALYRVDIDFSGATPAITGVTTFANFDGGSATSFGFGDIAIAADGTLYGSSTQGLFAVSLSGGSPTGYTVLNAQAPLLQIALVANGTALVGHSFNTGEWYDISLTGSVSKIDGFRTVGLRDIASIGAVPEPASVAMMGLGGLAVLALARRKARLAA